MVPERVGNTEKPGETLGKPQGGKEGEAARPAVTTTLLVPKLRWLTLQSPGHASRIAATVEAGTDGPEARSDVGPPLPARPAAWVCAPRVAPGYCQLLLAIRARNVFTFKQLCDD